MLNSGVRCRASSAHETVRTEFRSWPSGKGKVPETFQDVFPSLGSSQGSDKAIVVGLGPNELRSYKMRTSRWTVIISKQMICTAKFKFKTLHVQKCPSRSSHLVFLKFVWAKSYHNGSLITDYCSGTGPGSFPVQGNPSGS